MNPETRIMRGIQLALSAVPGVVLWRNNVGFDATNRVRYGLIRGASDLLGIVRIDGIGRFLAIEVKTPRGRLTSDQELFIELVRRMGGVAGVARSVADALEIVKGAK